MEKQEQILPFDVRILLNSELRRRMSQNDRYSLRAYARDLEVDPSDLSKILNGKRGLGAKLTRHFAKKLGFSEKAFKTDVDPEVPDYQQLSIDSFEVISDWCHYAILELTKLDNFKVTASNVADQLNLAEPDMELALARLIRLGFLEQKDGELVDGTEGHCTTVHHNFTAPAFKNLQRGILKGAQNALDEIPFEKRDQSSITIATSEEKLAQAKVMIKNFRRRLSKFLEQTETRDTIYNLSISLYPLNHKSGE